MSTTAPAPAVSFAHLAGIPPSQTALGTTLQPPGTRIEDDDARDPKADDDEDMRRAEEEQAKKAKKARRAKKARQRDDDDDGEDDPDDDEEDEEEDMKASSVTGRARIRERARCAAIFAHEAAAGNAPLAAHFAFNTAMTRGQAVAALQAAVAAMGARARRVGLDGRMAASAVPTVGADPSPPRTGAKTAEQLGDEIVRNYEAARGLKRA